MLFRSEALGQMLLTNQRLDKLAAARVDFTDRGMLDGNLLASVRGELGNVSAAGIRWISFAFSDTNRPFAGIPEPKRRGRKRKSQAKPAASGRPAPRPEAGGADDGAVDGQRVPGRIELAKTRRRPPVSIHALTYADCPVHSPQSATFPPPSTN